jgi:hypothetical protein
MLDMKWIYQVVYKTCGFLFPPHKNMERKKSGFLCWRRHAYLQQRVWPWRRCAPSIDEVITRAWAYWHRALLRGYHGLEEQNVFAPSTPFTLISWPAHPRREVARSAKGHGRRLFNTHLGVYLRVESSRPQRQARSQPLMAARHDRFGICWECTSDQPPFCAVNKNYAHV